MMRIIPLSPNRVWRTYQGGKNLDILSGKEAPADSHFPEDWIASLTTAVNPGREEMTEEGLSKVTVHGNLLLLRDLIEEAPEKMLGKNHYEKYGISISFLLKFLDSASRLHIQCHPTASFASQFLNSNFGKTEGYYILETRDDIETPFIYLGFQHPPSIEALKVAIEKQDIGFLESLFEKIPVKKGDAFFVPGGLPHAIGGGVFMIEIMEPTDLVIRMEFEKDGYILPEKARFMGRDIDFALTMIDFTPLSVDSIRSDYFISEKLVREDSAVKEIEIFNNTYTGCFRMNKLIVRDKVNIVKDCFYILIISDGEGEIQSGKETFRVRFGDKFFIPASTEAIQFNTESFLEVILAMPPE